MRVGIAGAGLGGLTLALMLAQRGIACELYEAAGVLRPLGVGINLLPHAMRELHALGLQPALADLGVETSSLAYFNRFGQPIWQEPRGLAAGYAWPQLSIHRGQLQMLLARTVEARLGGGALHLGQRAEGFIPDGDGAVVALRARDGTPSHRRVDVLVGADGIHSALRRQMHPTLDALQFSGRMLWRAVTEAPPYLDGRAMFMAGHEDQKFVAYPISEPLRRQGRSLVNWIAELRVSPDRLHGDWNREVPRSLFDAAFADWRWGWVDVPALIAGAEAVYEFPMVDRDPLPHWVSGRTVLLGDAAHPMYPIGSNGSAQAILDARCLADQLQGQPDVAAGLRAYEAERLPRTAAIVLRNRQNGPEQVMQIAHERAPHGFRDVHEVIPEQELADMALHYKRLAGFDPQSLAPVAH